MAAGMTDRRRCAFIGLGAMGFPMAGHLASAGHVVTVYNRNPAKAERWRERFAGDRAPTPAAAAAGADFVFTCVGNDDDLRAVVSGADGVLAAMQPGAVLVDHTTASAGVARQLAQQAARRGLGMLDAPVSGGQSGARNGVLTVMVGGEQAVFDRAEPLIACFAQAVTLMGPAGYGQLTKMMNQICIAGLLQGLSEGVNFAQRAGLDVDKALAVIAKGAAGSWQLDNRGATMARDQFDFGFAVDWMRKDLDICLAEAERVQAETPVTALINTFYARLQARGHGRWDTSSLIDLLRRP